MKFTATVCGHSLIITHPQRRNPWLWSRRLSSALWSGSCVSFDPAPGWLLLTIICRHRWIGHKCRSEVHR